MFTKDALSTKGKEKKLQMKNEQTTMKTSNKRHKKESENKQ